MTTHVCSAEGHWFIDIIIGKICCSRDAKLWMSSGEHLSHDGAQKCNNRMSVSRCFCEPYA
eukprot:2392387-Amphidinium_carterae.1